MRKIFLFDVDNVLVDPRAYVIGMQKTIKYFSDALNIPDFSPTLTEKQNFESKGVHDIWDITDIALAVQFDSMIRARNKDLSGSIEERLNQLRGINVPKPDYKQILSLIPGNSEYPPKDIEKILVEDSLIKEFVQNTRDVYKSMGTRVFQEILLGRETFERTYGLSGVTNEKESLIEKADVPLLSNNLVNRIRGNVSIYTGRPGLPPREPFMGYSPEAELALEIVKMKFPLVSMGCMEWLGKQKGEATEMLTKPDSTQAAAAIRAAITGRVEESLESAYDLTRKNLPDEYFRQLDGCQVYVFEDAPSGINAVSKAAEILRNQGINIIVRGIGIYGDNQSKKESLGKISERIFPEINEAIEYCFK